MKLNQLDSTLVDIGGIREQLLVQRVPKEIALLLDNLNLASLHFSSILLQRLQARVKYSELQLHGYCFQQN
jgi:hypothetical protein